MKTGFIALITFICFSLGSIENSFAQNGGASGAFLRLGFGAKGMSMSNAVSSVPELGTIGFYNPALAAGTTARNVETSSSLMSFDRNLHSISGSFRIPPDAGIQFMVMNASVSNIDGRTLSGYPTSTFATNDYLIQAAFGVKAKPNFWIGAAVKFLVSDYHPDMPNSTAFGLDLGVYYRASKEFSLSAVAKDVLLTHQWRSSELYGGQDQANKFSSFPTQLVLGGSYRFLDSRLIVSSEWIFRIYESEIQSRFIENNFNPPFDYTQRNTARTTTSAFQLGSSYHIHERVRIYLGYANRDVSYASDHHSFSSGFSLFLPFDTYSPTIDYSIVTEPNVGTLIHTFAFRFNL